MAHAVLYFNLLFFYTGPSHDMFPTELDTNNVISPLKLKTESYCHDFSEFQPVQDTESVIVVGASSFLGSRITAKFHNSGFKVHPVEDNLNRHIDPLVWYRWDRLNEYGLSPQYLDFTQSSELSSFLNHCNAGVIFYVPTVIFDGVHRRSRLSIHPKDSAAMLRNFVSLLELLIGGHLNVRLILVSLSNAAGLSVQRAWLTTLESALSSYQGLYGLKTAIVRMDGAYGLWQNPINNAITQHCLFVKDIEDAFLSIYKSSKTCEERDIGNCSFVNQGNHSSTSNSKQSAYRAWKSQYINSVVAKKKNVIMSTYFTRRENSMYTIIPDKFLFLKQWFISARKQEAFLVIFHDDLSVDFQTKVKNFYPYVEFIHQSSLNGWSANDGRFYMEYDYLLKHPDISHVLMTDLRDVKFFDNPFSVMEAIGDYIYVGIDVSYLLYSYELDWIRDIFDVCSKKEDHTFMELHPFLNAGVLGGTRHAMLTYMALMNKYLRKTPKFNCNMAAVNFVTNKFFHDVSFSGYPLQQGFKLGTACAVGQAIKHKDTGELDH